MPGFHSLAAVTLLVAKFVASVQGVPVSPCSYVQNTNCVCQANSSTLLSVKCNLSQKPIQPIFANKSSLALSLDTLDLSNNHLKDLPLNFLQAVSEVNTLTLAVNDLSLLPQALYKLNKVKVLDLSQNSFAVFPADSLCQLQGLEVLNLTANRIEQLSGPQSSNELKTLRTLDVSKNYIKDISPDSFAAMNGLVNLDLSSNQLTQVTATMLPALKYSLLSLNLSHNQITSLQPAALQHLVHLRVLILAHNYRLADVQDVQFPQHLAYLDLSHCALTNLSHCQISTLADLTYLGLDGNDLQCSCQLYLLLNWYESQHYKNGLWTYGPYKTDWNCTFPTDGADSTTTATTSTSAMQTLNTADASVTEDSHSTVTQPGHEDVNALTNNSVEVAGGKIYVSQLTSCQDTTSHCNALEHYLHHSQNSSQMEVKLQVVASSGSLIASWEVVEDGGVVIDGFRLQYVPENSATMLSPLLSAEQTSYTMTPKQLEQHYRVCLEVMAYETVTVKEECLMFKDEPANIVVGILAGVIFLVPCVIAMIVILCKDRHLQKEVKYKQLIEHEGDNSRGQEKKANASASPSELNSTTEQSQVTSTKLNQTADKSQKSLNHPHSPCTAANCHEPQRPTGVEDKNSNAMVLNNKCSVPDEGNEGKVDTTSQNAQSPVEKNIQVAPTMASSLEKVLLACPEDTGTSNSSLPQEPQPLMQGSADTTTLTSTSQGMENPAFSAAPELLTTESTNL